MDPRACHVPGKCGPPGRGPASLGPCPPASPGLPPAPACRLLLVGSGGNPRRRRDPGDTGAHGQAIITGLPPWPGPGLARAA